MTPPAVPADRLQVQRREAERIRIRTRRLVDGIFAGQYHSVFKGSGVEFAEVREYVPGDDVRAIDWNVTARTGIPFVKRYIEERELAVMLLVDVSASGLFGSVDRLKSETMVRLAAILAESALRNNDQVGFLLFSDRIERFEPPRKDRHRTLRLLHELLTFVPESQGTDLAAALEHLEKVVRRRTVTFLLSDFLARGYERALRRAHRRHEIVPVCVADRHERRLPSVGLLAVRDLETGKEILLDTRSAEVRRHYEERWRAAAAARGQLFASLGIDAVDVGTDGDHVRPLLRYFRLREQRRRDRR